MEKSAFSSQRRKERLFTFPMEFNLLWSGLSTYPQFPEKDSENVCYSRASHFDDVIIARQYGDFWSSCIAYTRTHTSVNQKKNMCFVPVVVIPWMLFTFQSHISDVWSERKWCAHLPQIKKKITEEKLMFRGKKRQIWFAIYLWVVEYKLMLANEFMERGWWDESTMALLLQQNLTHREWKRVFAINGRTFNWMV